MSRGEGAISREEAGAPERWTLRPQEPGYPPGLRDLPSPVRPAVNGVGELAAVAGLDPARAVTIVGSRHPSAYGTGIAREFAADLAGAGATIVSGMAIGIDAEAHRGALDAGGASVAVLAGGADYVYPARNRRLYRRLVERGAAVSERAFGSAPRKHDFPARNRIMAALSAFTLVVEAAEPSGTLITASWARELGRDVGAVPGLVGSRVAEGANGLIKDGAHLVEGAQDVLDLLAGVGLSTVERRGQPLDPELDRALEAIERGAGTVDRVASAIAIDGRRAAAAVARLELLGYVRCDPLGSLVRSSLARPAGPPAAEREAVI